MDSLTKVSFLFFICPGTLNGLSLIIILKAGGGKWPDKSLPSFYHALNEVLVILDYVLPFLYMHIGVN